MNEAAYMYQNRFSANVGGFGLVNRFAHGIFEGSAASGQYRQLHEMKVEMPSDVLQLFKANQVGFLKAPVKPKCRSLDPVLTMRINLMEMFQIPNLELMQQQRPQTRDERNERIARQKRHNNEHRIELEITEWNPFQDGKIDSDPERTLFIARLNYETVEKTLKFEFEKYGIIKKVTIVKDMDSKSCGYGFIQFDNKQDFLNAYKQANNRKIDGKRILVDIERGRTTLNWRPRRFGMGKGESRMSKEDIQKLHIKKKQQKGKDEELKQKIQKSPRHSRSRSGAKKEKKKEYDERDRKKTSREKDRKERKDRKQYRRQN